MSREKLEQHFVPQFYLRYFSNNSNGRSIGLYNFENSQFVRHASIKGQAREKNFYGKEIEEALEEFEGKMGQALGQLINNVTLPPPDSEELGWIFGFFALQSRRTKYAAEEQNEFTDRMIKEVLKHDSRFEDHLDKVNIELENPARFSLSYFPFLQLMISDLMPCLVVNNTSEPFITSDNPVVIYNQFLENREWPESYAGVSLRGTQLFLPLTYELALILYDPWAYIPTEGKTTIVTIQNPKDVYEMNKLQIINADENIYFDHHMNSLSLQSLKEESLPLRDTQKAFVDEFVETKESNMDSGSKKYVRPESEEANEDFEQSLVVGSKQDIRIDLNLSFLRGPLSRTFEPPGHVVFVVFGQP